MKICMRQRRKLIEMHHENEKEREKIKIERGRGDRRVVLRENVRKKRERESFGRTAHLQHIENGTMPRPYGFQSSGKTLGAFDLFKDEGHLKEPHNNTHEQHVSANSPAERRNGDDC